MQPILDLLQKTLRFFASPVGAALIAVISLLIAYGCIYYSRQQTRIAQLSFAGEASSRRSKFPFDQVKASDLTNEKILDRLRLSRANIPYIHRLPDEAYEKFREELFKIANQPNKSRLLIKGVTGIGKTREAIEFIQALDSKLPEDEKLTILIPRPDFDIPQEIPDDLRITNLLLFINDLHLKYYLRNERPLSEDDNSFHTRLVRVVNYFDELCQGYGSFRVIAITRSEPDLWERIQPNDLFWETFTTLDLPPLHANCVPQALESISKSFPNLNVETGVSGIISERNDGTFGSIILFLANETALGNEKISKKTAAQDFAGTYRAYWDKKIYQRMIAPHPERAKVFEALDILAQAHIPFYTSIVEDLSSRLWKSSYPYFLRRFIVRKSISEMKAWITKGEEFITCPEAYFEDRALLEQHMEQYIKSLADAVIHAISIHKNDRTFMNITINLADAIENEFKQLSVSLQIWEKLAGIYAYEPYIHFSLSNTLFWLGYLEKAMLESIRTLELDPTFGDAYCVRGDILCQMGKYRAAEKFYKTAVVLYSSTYFDLSWVLYERAQNLEMLGKKKQAEEHYLKALEIDPEYYSARYALSKLYREIGNYQEAANHFDISTKTQPKTATTLINLGKMYLAFERYREAAKMFTEAIETKTAVELFDYELFNLRGVAYTAQKLFKDASSDFAEAKRLAQRALRKSRRNINAHAGLIFAEVGLKQKNILGKILKFSRSAEFNVELMLLLDNVKVLKKVNNDPVYANAAQILEKRMLATAMSQTTPERVSILANLLRGRNNLAGLVKFERSPLELLASQASQMQSSLETQKITVEQEGVCVVLSGDQKFETIELRGKLIHELPELLNEGVQKTQERAAMILLQQIQSSNEGEDEPRPLIPGFNFMSDLRKLQEHALAMQSELETEIIEVRDGNAYAKFTGSQKINRFSY